MIPKAVYTITILRDAPNPNGAIGFVTYLLGVDGQSLMKAHGLALRPLALTGSAAAVPGQVKALLDSGK